MRYAYLLLFTLLSCFASAQVMQQNRTPGGYNFVALKSDSLTVISRGIDTPNIGNSKYQVPTIGAIFYKTTDSTFWLRSASRWNKVSVDISGKLNISDTAAMMQNAIRLIYRSNDSVYYQTANGNFFAYIDSTGGGGITNISYRSGSVIDTLYYTDGNGDTDFYYNITRDGLISGGVVTYSGVDLTYFVSAAIYRIGGQFYTTNDTTISIPVLADSDSSRVDAFVVNTSGQTTTIQGVESGNPLTPQVDPDSQIYLTHVTLSPANPVAGIDTVLIYDELAITEWPNRSATGVTVAFNSTNNPYRGIRTTETQGINNNDVIGYGTSTLYNKESYSALSLFIRLKSVMPSNNNIYISFFNGNSQVSNEQVLALSKTNTTSYQGISLSMNAFAWTNNFFDSIRVRYSGSAGITGLYLDFIYLQGGIDIAQPANFLTDIRRNGDDVQQQLNGVYTTQFSLSDKADETTTITNTEGYGIDITGGIQDLSANSTWTYTVDTTQISTRAWRDKLADSLGALIGASVSPLCGQYDFSTTTTAADPGNGNVRLNNATYASVTEVYVSQLTSAGTDVTNSLAALKDNDGIYIQDQDDATKFLRASVNGTPTDNGTWWTIAVDGVTSGGTLFSNNADLALCLIFAGAGGGGGSGTVTSVGLTMPSAFNVANSPVTTAGTLAVTGAGTTSQYIRGDGSLATYDAVSADSIAIRRAGTGLIHYLSRNSSWNGTVGISGAGIAQDSANYLFGLRTGAAMTSGYRNIAFGRATLKTNTTGINNIAIGDSVGFSTTSSNGIFIGQNNGGAENAAKEVTGNGNIAIGSGPLGSLSTADISGQQNIAIGNNTLPRITTGNYNVAVGGWGGNGSTVGAGRFLTTGSSNTFVGAEAGASVTTGSNNAFFGSGAGLSSNGTGNVGVGPGSLAAATSNNNTAIGLSSATGLTSGSITAIGYLSGNTFTTGTNNTIIGTSAASPGSSTTYTSGSDNTLIGASTMTANASLGAITPTGNTIIGASAARVGSGGDRNTVIGWYAGTGASSSNSITGTNNIAIGHAAGLPSYSSSNQISFWVGSSHTVGSAGGYNALTRFTGGQWLINNTTSAVTSAPNASAALEINGTSGGFLPPRLTGAQQNAIATPATGLMIYNTDSSDYTYYTGSAWQRFGRGVAALVGGGGVPSDSLAIRRAGTGLIHYISRNSSYNGTVGISGAGIAQDSANYLIGLRTGAGMTSGYRNIALGRAALKSVTTGYNNTAIGDSAGSSLKTGYGNFYFGENAGMADTSGLGNVALGENALSKFNGNGAAANNANKGQIAIGTDALKNATDYGGGSNPKANVAIGYQSQLNTTTGAANTAIGTFTMSGNTTGSENVAIGQRAGSNAAQTGTRNIAIGGQSLFSNTSGGSNIAIGSINALNANTTGSNNTAIGTSALASNTSGGNNVAIGNSALALNTTASENIAFGFNANYNNQTGTGTITIGHGARSGTWTNLTGFIRSVSENIIIGYEAGNQLSAASNTIIGYRANYNSANVAAQNAFRGTKNIVIGYKANQPDTTLGSQVTIGADGVNWLQRFNGGGWLINNTTSAVVTQTASAALEINGTTGAVLFPRLTTAQRDSLTGTNGMVIYNSTTDKLQVYAAGAWVDLH